MAETEENMKAHPRFSGWPYNHFKKFQEFAIKETGEPGIYWLTVKILMERYEYLTDYVEQLEKQLTLYEEALLEDVSEEPAETPEPSGKSITLGGHSE